MIPFGGTYYTVDFWVELIRGDFGDALAIFLVLILPILIYTFFLSWLIHYGFRKIERRQGEEFQPNWKYLSPLWLAVFLLAPSIWPHSPVHIGGTQPVFRPFGVVYYVAQLWEQLAVLDMGIAQILPRTINPILVILVYSFALSVIIYYFFWKVRRPRLSTA